MYQTWLLSRTLRATLGLALSTTFLVACSKENNVAQTENNFEGLKTAVINANGGKLEGDGGLSVEVPAGAVSQPVTIAGGPVDDLKAPALPSEVTKLGLIFTLQPHGQNFGKPVSINIPFKTTGPSMKLYTAQPNGVWAAVPGAAPQGTTLRAQVDHFSFFVVVSEDPCIKGGKSAPDGTTCGTDKVCKAGLCQVCQAGGSCALAAGECKEGVLSCATGAPLCVSSSKNRPEGASCGGGKVCDEGTCKACEEGKTCTDPAFACKVATLACGSGTPVCEATAADRKNGEGCGTGKSCFNGACIACEAGLACAPANACKKASIACGTGQPICEETGTNASNGTSCGTDLACLDGTCGACATGTACVLPESPCKQAASSCETGTSVCKATATNVTDGTACGAGKICGAGVCTACVEGEACVPTTGPCHAGKSSCASGAPVCMDTGNAAAGVSCGAGKTCDGAGACAAIDGVLSAVGDGQSAMINQVVATPLVVTLSGKAGELAGKIVKITSTGVASADPPEAMTNSQGKAVFQIRVGRKIGKYDFQVTTPTAAAITVSATATEPPVGTVIPIVNAKLEQGAPGSSSKATVAVTAPGYNALTGIAADADGTLYVAQGSRIYRVPPDGSLARIAGDPNDVNPLPPGGDGGPAIDAGFYQITDLALNRTSRLLYVNDRSVAEVALSVVRVIDLQTGIVDKLGGDGSVGAPTYGDDGPIGLAQIRSSSSRSGMSVGPDGAVYFVDSTARRIRRYDPITTLVSKWLGEGDTVGSQKVCRLDYTPAPAILPNGEGILFSNSDCAGAFGIVRRGASSLTLLTKPMGPTGSPSIIEGPASEADVGLGLCDVDTDGAGTLYGTICSSNIGVFRINQALQIKLILGDFATNDASTGNYGPATAAKTRAQRSRTDAAGNLYVLESKTVRMVWKAGSMLRAQSPASHSKRPPLTVAGVSHGRVVPRPPDAA